MPAVFGIPRLDRLGRVTGASAWDSSGSGAARTYQTFYPLPDSLIVLATVSNNFLANSVDGMNASWTRAAVADLSSGNYAIATLFVGRAGKLPRSNMARVVWAGSNSQGIVAAMLSAPARAAVVATTFATKSGSGSLVIPPVVAPAAGVAVMAAYTRGGTLADPAGWTSLAIGSIAGTQSLVWKSVAAGESVGATWTGPTDNSAGAIVILC